MAELYKEYEPSTLKKIQELELKILKDFCDLCDRHDINYFGIAGTCIGVMRHGGFIPWDDDIDVGLLRQDYDRFISVAKRELKDKYIVMNTETNHNYPLMTTRLMLKGTEFREECFKTLPCEMGIFLDIYCFDNVSNNKLKMYLEGARAWFWGKLMILCAVKEPVLYFGGWKKKVVYFACRIVHKLFNLLNIKPYAFYKRVKKIITKYKKYKTDRVAYFFDPLPYSDLMAVSDIYPFRELDYDGIKMKFPQKMEYYTRKRYGDYMQLPPPEKRHNHPPCKLDLGPYDVIEEKTGE